MQRDAWFGRSGRCVTRGRSYVGIGDIDQVWPIPTLAVLETVGIELRDQTFANQLKLNDAYPGTSPQARWLVGWRPFVLGVAFIAALRLLIGLVFYAIGQGIRDGDEQQPVSIFLPTYLVLSAGVCTAFLAGDLFNLFVGFDGAGDDPQLAA